MIKSKEHLKGLSKLAATNFVHKQIPLNETLEKIASEEELNPDQIRFLAQETNKQAWSDLFKMDKTAAYSFELADSEKVLEKLQVSDEGATIKEIDLDYMEDPAQLKVAHVEEDPFEMLGVEKTAAAKNRSKKEVLRDLNYKLEKLSQAKSTLHMNFLENNTAAENIEVEIVKGLKNDLLGMSWPERHGEFQKFAGVAFRVRGDSRMQERLGRIKHVLEEQGVMQKTAGLEAPEQYINRDTGAQVINGNHYLVTRIKTLMEFDDKAHEAHVRKSVVDATLPKVREAIREL